MEIKKGDNIITQMRIKFDIDELVYAKGASSETMNNEEIVQSLKDIDKSCMKEVEELLKEFLGVKRDMVKIKTYVCHENDSNHTAKNMKKRKYKKERLNSPNRNYKKHIKGEM